MAARASRRQVLGERRDRQREQHPAAHREDVGQGVGRGDLAERPRVVDERREEVERADDREVRRDQVDGRIVGRVEPGDEPVGRRPPLRARDPRAPRTARRPRAWRHSRRNRSARSGGSAAAFRAWSCVQFPSTRRRARRSRCTRVPPKAADRALGLPTALAIAFAMAGATVALTNSPAPFAPNAPDRRPVATRRRGGAEGRLPSAASCRRGSAWSRRHHQASAPPSSQPRTRTRSRLPAVRGDRWD